MPLLANLIIFDAVNFDPFDIPGSSAYYYAFDSMRGDFQPKQQQLEGIVRAGVDGEQLRETGVRGDAFSILTVLYLQDRQDAVDAITAYVTLVDGNPYEIWANGQSWGYFKILKVINGGVLPCANVVGSLVSGAEIKHTVAFQVISTDAP